MDMPETFRRAAHAWADDLLDSRLSLVEKKCDSPIEVLFALAFWTVADGDQGGMRFGGSTDADVEWLLAPQVQVGPYRVDFVASWSGGGARPVIVECDGHDFHERTKQQAARDKKRDRELQGSGFGYDVFRFTGSEIVSDAFRCAYDVIEQLNRNIDISRMRDAG